MRRAATKKMPRSFVFFDENGAVVKEIRDIFALPLKEAIVIAKSVEMFGDPDPCVIHRSAVVKKIILETDGDDLGELVEMPDGAVVMRQNQYL